MKTLNVFINEKLKITKDIKIYKDKDLEIIIPKDLPKNKQNDINSIIDAISNELHNKQFYITSNHHYLTLINKCIFNSFVGNIYVEFYNNDNRIFSCWSYKDIKDFVKYKNNWLNVYDKEKNRYTIEKINFIRFA